MKYTFDINKNDNIFVYWDIYYNKWNSWFYRKCWL